MNSIKDSQNRRSFLKSALITSASLITCPPLKASFFSTSCSSSLEVSQLPESSSFHMGVASGDVTTNKALLWTQHSGYQHLKLALWKKKDPSNDTIFITKVSRKDGGFIHVDMDGLEANHDYCYAFVETNTDGLLEKRSNIGRFKTPPTANQLKPLTIGAISCVNNAYSQTLLEHASKQENIDFFLLLGDSSYNDGSTNIHEYRDLWKTNLSQKGFIDLRASTSVLATLDDHEIFNNFDPETINKQHFTDAIQALFEHQPIRQNKAHPFRIWRSFRWGQTLEVFVLDCRTERKPSTRRKKNARYISPEQMKWLKEGLAKSDAVFKVIANSVPISDFPLPETNDRWIGYPAQREEILSFIDKEKINVLWVSGDFHFASVGNVAKKGPGKTQKEILAGPGAQIPNPLCLPLNLSSQFDWASARNNYVTLQFDPYKLNVKLNYQGSSEDPNLLSVSKIETIYEKTLRLGK